MRIIAAICLASIVLVLALCTKQTLRYPPVSPFDVKKYLGTWYEIARLPASFEKNMTHVTAVYSLKENGKVMVDNKGLVNGERKEAVGKAFLAGAPNEGFLKVSFFGPFYANYVIVALDENYSYAMVASSPKYLWILSRTPILDKEILIGLLDKAKKLGFDTGKLYFTPQ